MSKNRPRGSSSKRRTARKTKQPTTSLNQEMENLTRPPVSLIIFASLPIAGTVAYVWGGLSMGVGFRMPLGLLVLDAFLLFFVALLIIEWLRATKKK